MSALPRNTILAGDALTHLKQLPDQAIDSVVTSPPYFRLRDYQVEGQIGLEAHVDQWVEELQTLLHEVKRVLVPTGTVWLNLGDGYSLHHREGAGRKGLLLGPERLALRLLDNGWIIRNKIVWAKPNPMPSSVRDRLSTTYEVIYLLARSPRYFFDLDAIRAPHRSRAPGRKRTRPPTRTDSARPAWLGPNSDSDNGLRALKYAGLTGHPLGKNPGDVWQIATSGYRGAHFATYPVRLAERMVLAGTPEKRCIRCRSPYRRSIRRLGAVATRLALQAGCGCNAGSEPGLVLDPFIGSGTTAIAAERHRRDWLGIELNPEFVAMATDRIEHARTSTTRTSAQTTSNNERR